MNDIRRTILWVVFGFSMVLLWDQWQLYNGHKATFFPGPAKTVATANPQAPTSGVPSAVSATNNVAATAHITGATAQLAINSNAVAAPRERIVLTTDVLKLTLDTEGASLVRTEFLKHVDKADKTQNFVLLDESNERTYVRKRV